MAYSTILVERDNSLPVATVTVNRPEKLNPLNSAVLQELGRAFAELDNDESVRVIIMTGMGDRSFIAGADINELNALADPVKASEHARFGQALCFQIERLGKPVIMAINGFALGGGLEIAMAGDIRIAAETAQLGQPEIDLGIIPGFGGTQRLARLVGIGRAKLMIMTGQRITASEALRIGLVEKVVPLGVLNEEARLIASQLAEKPPIALKLAKAAINDGLQVDLDRGCGIEASNFGLLFNTSDRKEGTSAFLEKRKPTFKGK